MFRIYLMDLSQMAATPLGAQGFQWGGTVRTLRLDPTNQAGVQVEIDWARLVSIDPTLCRTITWSGGGTVNIYLIDATTNANLGPIALGAVATSGNANSASAGCGTSGTGYKFYAGALAPGTYKVGVSASGGASPAANISAGTWVVNDAPTINFVTPSPEGGDDFATVELGNPVGHGGISRTSICSASSTARQCSRSRSRAGPASTSVPRTVLTGTSIAGPAGGLHADPHFGLLWNPGRGATKRIDPNKYRILTVDMGVQNFARNINVGSIARVAWRVAGNEACCGGSESVDDIIFTSRAGANVVNTLTMDLADRAMVAIEEGCPDGLGARFGRKPGTGSVPHRSARILLCDAVLRVARQARGVRTCGQLLQHQLGFQRQRHRHGRPLLRHR